MRLRMRICVFVCVCLCGSSSNYFDRPVSSSISISPWVNYIWAESSRGDEVGSAISIAEPVGFIKLETNVHKKCSVSYFGAYSAVRPIGRQIR